MGDFRFKVIDFDNACEIGENHPGGFSRGYVSPEVFSASQRRNNATTKSLDIKASVLSEIFNLGILLCYLGSVFVNKLGGRHGNYTVLPVSLGDDSELSKLLTSDQQVFEDYIFGRDGALMAKKYCIEIIRSMIALDPNNRTPSLKTVLQSFDVSITVWGKKVMGLENRIVELESDKAFLQNEIINKLGDVLSAENGLGKTLSALQDSFTAVLDEQKKQWVRINKQDAEQIEFIRRTKAEDEEELNDWKAQQQAQSNASARTLQKINGMVEELLSKITIADTKLNGLLENCYDLPTFISVESHNINAWKEVKKLNFSGAMAAPFKFVLSIQFHCEFTLEPSPSPPYEVEVTKEWVR